ncbi:MAG: hypothetical protein IKI37_11865 [Oscillospiraceae bacterium]|nr:hypothetical protein [Oscillospiraceae bacterium]MBR7085846.1 hypothetical protein [Oscillospiraceae bacterium]
MRIKNYEETVETLARMMAELEKETHPYWTDIYLYLSDDGVATLCEYQNVGGNSWLDDNHYTIYRNPASCDGVLDRYFLDCEASDFAEILNIPAEELLDAAAKFSGLDDGEIPDLCEVKEYLRSDSAHMAVLQAVYEESIDEMHDEYAECARCLINDFVTKDTSSD